MRTTRRGRRCLLCHVTLPLGGLHLQDSPNESSFTQLPQRRVNMKLVRCVGSVTTPLMSNFTTQGSHDKHHRSCNGGLSLSDLPVEIIWQIASYLATPTITCLLKPITVRQRKYDLCSVRLVCRDLKLKVQEPFMRAAFGELEVDMVPEALQKLIEISEDPEVSSVVKTLYFLADQGGGDLDHEAWYEDNMERIYMENGAGAALITRALEGFSHLKCVKIQPVQWVSM